MRHYALTKRAQLVLAEQLHEASRPLGIEFHGMHPGWVDTPAVRRAMPKLFAVTRPILRNPRQGGDTISWLVGAPAGRLGASSGFWFDRTRVPAHLSARTEAPPSEEAALIPWIDDRLAEA